MIAMPLRKYLSIKLCESLRVQHNFDAISLMPTNLYGPKDNYDSQNSHVMAALIKKFCEAQNTNSPQQHVGELVNLEREFMM